MNKTLKKKKTRNFYRDHLPRLCGFGSPDLGDFAITGSQDGLKPSWCFQLLFQKDSSIGDFRNFVQEFRMHHQPETCFVRSFSSHLLELHEIHRIKKEHLLRRLKKCHFSILASKNKRKHHKTNGKS